MKPVAFDLHQPGTLQHALELLAEHGADGKVLAGGQSLMPLLNFRLSRPEHVIDLSKVASLRALRRTPGLLSVGAMVTYAQAQRSPAVSATAPLVAAALPHIGHQAIRNRGTIGGSVAHGDPAAELPAVMVALEATVVAASVRGTRMIPAAEFFKANLVTALADDELLTEVRVPAATGITGAAFEEVGRRHGDFALAGAGAQVRLAADGTISEARIALTGVSPRPHRAREAERLLVGARPENALLEEAADAVRKAVAPIDDLHATADYRRDIAGTLTARAVADAVVHATATPTLEATP